MNIHDLQANASARQQDYERAFLSNRRSGTAGSRHLFAFLRRSRRNPGTAQAPRAAFGAPKAQPGS